ncbi:unnamed protein product [Brugia pahangi]|uniref:Uncharacterized protein n=1 Tax=Brugia pahangi TaxID=6280 RepID=A0A0N4TXQ8_BRUPA|nr:unnamed protein product [Brugia pahangi]
MSRRAVGEKYLSYRLDCANDLLSCNMLTAVVTVLDDIVAPGSISKLPEMSKVYCATIIKERLWIEKGMSMEMTPKIIYQQRSKLETKMTTQ